MKGMTFLVIIFFATLIIPQSENKSKYFSLSLSGGTCTNNPISYYFYGETEDEFINPGLYVNFGVGYGPFRILDLTEFSMAVTVGYTKVSTSVIELEHYPSDAQLIIETFPVLIWGRLQTDTKLSPFIELGIGASRLNFLEMYSYGLNGTSFNYWAFAYASGAGLKYIISEDFEIALAVSGITNEKEHIEMNDRYHNAGINVRNVVYAFYLRVDYNL